MDTQKTAWDKAAIVLQPVGGLLTALAVAFVGLLGTRYLDRSKQVDSQTSLYAQLMSQREQSDTSLRQEMFKSIVSTFLTPPTAKLEQKVLGLEMLAQNFHESMELSPLFKHLKREVDESHEDATRKEQYSTRLEGVARLIVDKQIEILTESGVSIERSVRFDELEQKPEGVTFCRRCFPLTAEAAYKAHAMGLAAGVEKRDEKNPRCIRADLAAIDKKAKALQVRLNSNSGNGDAVEHYFWVDYFSFPLVDNTRLSDDQRLAVALTHLADTSASLTFVYFPGSRAGLKDRPYYDDILRQLRHLSDENAPALFNPGLLESPFRMIAPF
jgi:hypothetical protein